MSPAANPGTLAVACNAPLPRWLWRDVESRFAFVDEDVAAARVTDDGRRILLTLRPGARDERSATIVERALRLIDSMRDAVEPRVRIVESHRTSPPGCGGDADTLLTRSREVHEEIGGVTVLGPRLAALVAAIDTSLAAVAKEVGAVPYCFPALIDPSLLDRLHAFQYFPHTLGFAAHVRRDLDTLERFAAAARAGGAGVDAPAGSFAAPRAMLTPAVCYHLYGFLANRTLDEGKLVATTLGKCFRHESSNMTSLERLWDFTVRELVFVGSPEFVLAGREAVQALAREYFAAIGLDHHVETAHDHFFGAEFRRQAPIQSAFELKLEVRAALPHKATTLAVASYNYHQDFFGRRMNIRLPDGTTAHTACVGFGLERLAYAIVSQFGLDPARWPEAVRPSPP
jgi:seryl-tRNA synthetase